MANMKWYDNMTCDADVEEFRKRFFAQEREGKAYAEFVMGTLAMLGVNPIYADMGYEAIVDTLKLNSFRPEGNVSIALMCPRDAEYIVGWDRVTGNIMYRFLGTHYVDLSGRHKYLIGYLAKMISSKDDISSLESMQEMLLNRRPKSVQEELIYSILVGKEYLEKLDHMYIPARVSVRDLKELKFDVEFNVPDGVKFGLSNYTYEEMEERVMLEISDFRNTLPSEFYDALSDKQLMTYFIFNAIKQ